MGHQQQSLCIIVVMVRNLPTTGRFDNRFETGLNLLEALLQGCISFLLLDLSSAEQSIP
jgi:hypothetical protein